MASQFDTSVGGQGGSSEQQSNSNTTGGEFSTNSPAVSQTAAPSPSPVQTPAMLLGPQGGGGSSGSSAGSALGGIAGSVISKGIGAALGALFNQGGIVGSPGYAAGGQIGNSPDKQKALAEGYLVGAHHQQKYGGDPKMLGKAAAEIKQMLASGPQGQSTQQQMPVQTAAQMPTGMAQGGLTNYASGGEDDAQLVQAALNQSLGIVPQGQSNAPTSQQSNQAPQQDTSPVPQQLSPQGMGSAAPTGPSTTNPNQTMLDNASNDQVQHAAGGAFIMRNWQAGNVPPGMQKDLTEARSPDVARQLYQPGQGTGGGPGNTPRPMYGNTYGPGAPAMQQAQGGYMGYAAGGPPMPAPPMSPGAPNGPSAQANMVPPNAQQGPPPLKPGQVFQGDGSVKGPGGPTDDAIPAKLSNGEFVMSEAAVQYFGVDKLIKMNEKGKQGFMQALGQVQANQPGGGDPNAQQSVSPPPTPGAPPQGQPPGQPSMPPQGAPPVGQARGGVMAKPHGYMGL